ncbi:MAG TPA: TadE/TadG family type IV pilus assembly protein [Chloroflexota bacterium]|nr:TadE/TadG family type IV pilus assembly protein [Chloroflexota bacterium]
MRVRSRGQALVEFALMLPIIVFFGLALLQLIILFLTYLSVLNITRDAARWVAVHPHNTDDTNIAQIVARIPSNLTAAQMPKATCPSSGIPNPGLKGIQICPPCMTVDPILGCVDAANQPIRVAARNDVISVTVSYDAGPNIFLPHVFGIPGRFQVGIPTSLPSYTMYMLAEPAIPNG